MSKSAKIFFVFILIYLIGFFAIYLYIKLFLDEKNYAIDMGLKESISYVSTLL